MPVPDPRTGSAFVWLLSILFFLAIITGGIFLLIYILLPEYESASWMPVAGFSLVGIPWSFWFFTIIYRCISRGLGLSGSNITNNNPGAGMGGARADAKNSKPLATTKACDGGGGDGDDDSSAHEEKNDSPGSGERKVRFGGAVVLGGGDKEEGFGGLDSGDDDHDRSANDDDYDDLSSVASHESEAPLTLSIQS